MGSIGMENQIIEIIISCKVLSFFPFLLFSFFFLIINPTADIAMLKVDLRLTLDNHLEEKAGEVLVGSLEG